MVAKTTILNVWVKNTDFFDYVRQFSRFPPTQPLIVEGLNTIMGRDSRRFHDSQWEDSFTYGDGAAMSGTTLHPAGLPKLRDAPGGAEES